MEEREREDGWTVGVRSERRERRKRKAKEELVEENTEDWVTECVRVREKQEASKDGKYFAEIQECKRVE